ncbi:MAG: FAD-binding protein [Kiritimatiellaeota bacterium]|nr:FAD-binding protein [Kiritimatiellota bacterium]
MQTTRLHTLVIGSGAAGLAAAVHLKRMGVRDVAIVTEGLGAGTSINTGSDKQTYYKLGLCGDAPDSPRELAETLFNGGSMHGDLALVEAANSARAFLNLVNLGVPFPRDRFGQFPGYKTDHDPRRRATSTGPYTSRDMCRALIAEVRRLQIPVYEDYTVVSLVREKNSILGCVAFDADDEFHVFLAPNTVFATGGPGGLYDAGVYPPCHTGGIGLALEAGALCQSLPESQYGMASVKFRWNVSGTYMQVVPRFFSTDADGVSNPREFLDDHFRNDRGKLFSLVFLKGYQWPFDARKVAGGSSFIDLLVHIETVVKGRRVFLDYRENPRQFAFASLSDEAKKYLEKSGASQDTPFKRLEHMNPGAVALYREHGIDLAKAPLEIAVCAQHNNGGLAANHWWQSENIPHLFPIGEVNGSHGVARPGGTALNAGQVGAFRAADFIAHGQSAATPLQVKLAQKEAETIIAKWRDYAKAGEKAQTDWRGERKEFQKRMTDSAAQVRDPETVAKALKDAEAQYLRLKQHACKWTTPHGLAEACRNLQLALACCAYLSAIKQSLADGVGSRGSSIAIKPDGVEIDPALGASWRIAPEDESFRGRVLTTTPIGGGRFAHKWERCRPIPREDLWFETVWRKFREGEIYK